MSYKTIIAILLFSFTLGACSSDFKFTFNSSKKIAINQELVLSVSEKNNYPIDSVQFSIDGKKVTAVNSTSAKVAINNYTLGKHALTAIVFFENKTKKLNNTVYFLADKAPIMYTYKVINTYPHDPMAFTQGLEYHKGYLYESTGQRGQSSIRKVELKTGKILQKVDIDAKYFGEGITIFNDKLYFLTWQSKVGFVYNLNTFEQESSFPYGQSKEGWGLTHNQNELLKSDGTERIWFLDPETKKETHFIEAYTNKRKAESLNELEYIDGKIYSNIWQKNTILIIDATNGTIEGIVNLNSLKNLVKTTNNDDQVLNGIAYDAKNNRLFVTGKNWDKLFEIELIKK